jgi:hypothetical protein
MVTPRTSTGSAVVTRGRAALDHGLVLVDLLGAEELVDRSAQAGMLLLRDHEANSGL